MSMQKIKNVKQVTKDFEKNAEKCEAYSDSEQSETEAGSLKEVVLYKNFLKEISDSLISIISKKAQIKNEIKKTPFDHDHMPKISIYDYLLRIQKYSNAENNTIILAIIYIDRICNKTGLILNKYNIHRILISAILVAIKYNEDQIYDNVYFSKVAGVPVSELNYLERKFLEIINYDLFVSDELFKKYYKYLNSNDIS